MKLGYVRALEEDGAKFWSTPSTAIQLSEIDALRGGDCLSEHPLKILEKLDPELLKLVESTSRLALADGALPKK